MRSPMLTSVEEGARVTVLHFFTRNKCNVAIRFIP